MTHTCFSLERKEKTPSCLKNFKMVNTTLSRKDLLKKKKKVVNVNWTYCVEIVNSIFKVAHQTMDIPYGRIGRRVLRN